MIFSWAAIYDCIDFKLAEEIWAFEEVPSAGGGFGAALLDAVEFKLLLEF